MKKVVCFFINNVSNSGGTERVSSIIANQLSRHDYSVLVVSLFSNDNQSFFELDDGIEVRTLFKEQVRGLYSFPLVFFRLKKLLAERRVDVVVNVDSILAAYTIPVCRFSKRQIRNICWEHFNYRVSLGKKARSISRTLAARYCDDVVTLTERDKSLWIDRHPGISNIVAINNPSQTSSIEPAGDRVSNKTAVSIGRLTHQKGFDLLIKAFSLVTKQRSDWVLSIVGDGEDRPALAQLIEDLDLTDHIKLLPATPQIAEIYRNSSLYVMSSRFEGLPMVLLEATACGLPIVAFDCDTGPGEVVTSDSGWLCKPNDVSELARTLLKAMDECEDPVAYERFSKSAVSNSRRFSVESVARKWVNLLER